MYKTREEVESWLNFMQIKKYVINEDLTVDVNEGVNISNNNLNNIPIKFGVVNGYFNCNYNELSNLEGCPNYVKSGFYCFNNKLTSLEDSPKVVNGNFYCSNNELINLKGCPEVIKGNFSCFNNKLTSLKGCPKVVNGNFDSSNNSLTSLEGVFFIGSDLYCNNNKIKDLSHLNINNVKDIYLSKNEIVECNWIDNTEEKSFFSKISLLFKESKKIDLSNNNIDEKGLLSVKSTSSKIVIKLKDNKDLYFLEEYDEKYLSMFKLIKNLSIYQNEKMKLIKKELNIFKNEMRDEFKGEKIIKKRKL